MHNLEYGTTPEAEQTRRRFKALLQKKKRLNEDAVGPHSTWLYRFQLFPVLLNLGMLVNHTLIDPAGTTASINAIGVVLAALVGWFYLRPRHKLAQLKKRREELRNTNKLVELEWSTRELIESRCYKAGLTSSDAYRLLEDFPDLAVKIAKAQVDLAQAKEEGLERHYVDRIKASLAQSIDDIAVPQAEVQKAQAALERSSLKDRLELEY
jgi:hypothetical protein